MFVAHSSRSLFPLKFFALLHRTRDEHDKLEKRHNELITRYNLVKDEYTTLKINHDSLVVANELSSYELHDATNHVVKIDIATSYDDLIVESIEQGSSSKGKKAVKSDNYDDYAKLKSENENLKKDLEKATTTNTVVIENLDNDEELTLENEKLKEENKRLKFKMSCVKQTTNESLIEENTNRHQDFSPEVYVLAGMLVPVVSTNTWWFGS
jgi:hypothetical protein